MVILGLWRPSWAQNRPFGASGGFSGPKIASVPEQSLRAEKCSSETSGGFLGPTSRMSRLRRFCWALNMPFQASEGAVALKGNAFSRTCEVKQQTMHYGYNHLSFVYLWHVSSRIIVMLMMPLLLPLLCRSKEAAWQSEVRMACFQAVHGMDIIKVSARQGPQLQGSWLVEGLLCSPCSVASS